MGVELPTLHPGHERNRPKEEDSQQHCAAHRASCRLGLGLGLVRLRVRVRDRDRVGSLEATPPCFLQVRFN